MLYLSARIINKLIYWTRLCSYHSCLAIAYVYLMVKWSPWNPWCVARLNLAWSKYSKTPMYEERLKVPKEFHTDKNFENYAEQAYIENFEAELFVKLFTWKDKLKVIFTPFSCGNRNHIPFYLIVNWIMGEEE